MEEIDKAQQLYSEKKVGKEIEKQLESFAMWSFVLSIAPLGSFLFLLIPILNILFILFLFVAPILSIIFGIIGLKNVGENKKFYGNGFAIAGIIISILEFFICILVIILFIGFFPGPTIN